MEMMFDHYVLEVTWFVCDLYSISSHKPQIENSNNEDYKLKAKFTFVSLINCPNLWSTKHI